MGTDLVDVIEGNLRRNFQTLGADPAFIDEAVEEFTEDFEDGFIKSVEFRRDSNFLDRGSMRTVTGSGYLTEGYTVDGGRIHLRGSDTFLWWSITGNVLTLKWPISELRKALQTGDDRDLFELVFEGAISFSVRLKRRA